jgi:glycosyltransferase involved in cell wall biosynthesis
MRPTHKSSVTFAIPGDLDTPTGGYGYARGVIAALRARGWRVDVIDLGDSFPHVDVDQRALARARLLAAPVAAPLVVDGLALGALPDEAHDAARSHCLVGLVHHPLALETGLSAAMAQALRVSEIRALAATRHVITTDHSTAETLAASYEVPREHIAVALPGAPRVEWAHGSRNGVPQILAVGAVVPRKGYALLVTALAELADLPWRLTIVGDRGRSPETAAELDALIERARLTDRITCTGAVTPERLDALYRGADVFVQPSWFEGYGMALADALAYGLPVVATQTGAALRNVGPDAGRIVPPGDICALARALRALLADTHVRAGCAAAARAAARNLPSWDDTAMAFEHVLASLNQR